MVNMVIINRKRSKKNPAYPDFSLTTKKRPSLLRLLRSREHESFEERELHQKTPQTFGGGFVLSHCEGFRFFEFSVSGFAKPCFRFVFTFFHVKG